MLVLAKMMRKKRLNASLHWVRHQAPADGCVGQLQQRARGRGTWRGQSGPDTAEVTTTTTTTQLSAHHLPSAAPLYLAAGPRVTCEDVPGVTGLRDSVTVTVAAQYNCAVRHHSSHGGRVSAGTSSVARVAVYAAQQCPGYWPHLHTPPP